MALRVAVIGAGVIGKTHVEQLSKLKDGELLAVADLDEAKARRLQSEFKFPETYSDFEEMLDKAKPDGVFICTPPHVHLDPIKAAAERGVAVFVEKPLDSNIRRAKESVAACRKAGIITQMGYHWRFHGGRAEAREVLLEKGGTIGMFEGKWWGGVYNVPWWIRREMSGGQITEQTTHIFDQARWLVGDVESVQALLTTMINTEIEGYNIEDASAVLLKYKSGAIGVVTSTNASVAFEAGAKVVARNLKYADFGDRVVITWRDREAEYRGKRSPYEAEDEAFLSCLKGGQPSAVDMEEGLKSVELSLGAILSSGEGRKVDLPL